MSRTRHHHAHRQHRRRTITALALGLVVATTTVATALPSVASAAPTDRAANTGAGGTTHSGTTTIRAAATDLAPGIPADPAILYTEDFENGSGATLLADYASTQGVRYQADPYWSAIEQCNGFVTRYSTARPSPSYCDDDRQWDLVRAKTYALGLLGDGDPEQNAALSTNSNPPSGGVVFSPGEIEFATATDIPLPSSTGRFVTFSVDAAATDCQETHPLLRFSLRHGTEEQPISDRPIDPCASAQARVFAPGLALSDEPYDEVSYGSFPADSSVLFDGDPLGLVLRNEATGISGNDGAIDNIRILDVTPRLDVTVPSGTIATDGTGTVTWTITNTSDLAAKDGWGFTAGLPAGVRPAVDAAPTTTCATGTPRLDSAGSQLSLTGSLRADEGSCSVSLRVTAADAGDYTFDAAAVRTTGLEDPESTVIRFADPALVVETTTATPADTNDSGRTDAGDTVPVTVVVRNPGGVDLTDVTVRVPGVDTVDCPTTVVPAGGAVSCSGTHVVTRDDLARGTVRHTASVTATPTGGAPITATSAASETVLVVATPTLAVTVVADPARVVGVDAAVEHRITVANSGPVPVSDVRVTLTDPEGSTLGTATCAPLDRPLDSGASVACAWTLRTTAADVARGAVAVTVLASGVGVDLGDTVRADPVTVSTRVDPAATVVVDRPEAPAAPAGRLAHTGASVSGPLAAALAMLLLGAGLGAARYRRR